MARSFEYEWSRGFNIYVQTPQMRRMEDSRDMLLRPEPAKDVRLYALFLFFRRRYETMLAQSMASLTQSRWHMVRSMSLAGTLAACASGSVYLYVIWLVVHGQISVGALSLYGGAATLLQAQMLSLSFFAGLLPIHLNFLPSLLRVIEHLLTCPLHNIRDPRRRRSARVSCLSR